MTDPFGRQLRELRARVIPVADGPVQCSICTGEICEICYGCDCTPCDCPEKEKAWLE